MEALCSNVFEHFSPPKTGPAFVKTRSNSFHSTLEPNTEVFSKVFRSLAQFTLVNSVSTLLNKGGSTCNCPKLLRTSALTKTNKQVHSYSAPALCPPDTSEARVGETAARLKNTLTQSNTHLFRDVSGTSQVSSAHHGQLKNMSTCQSHATNMPRFMPMFVQVKTPTNLKRQIEGTLEESIFSAFPRSSAARRRVCMQ